MDARKKYYAEVGNKQSTATTLRLVEPWRGSKRVVIGDSWFGSVRTAEELAEIGLHSILCVKGGHAGYPRDELRAVMKERGDTKFLKTDVRLGYEGEGDVITFYAGAHMDKKALTLVGDCGMTIPGPAKTRHRYKYQGGQVVHSTWSLEQPHMHAVYRENFNAIDQINRAALGDKSLANGLQTKIWWKKVALCMLSLSVHNAYMGYARPWRTGRYSVARSDFIDKLASELISNIFVQGENVGPGRPLSGRHGYQEYEQNLRVCNICNKRTHWHCECGVWTCPASTSRLENKKDCFVQHVYDMLSEGSPRTRRRVTAMGRRE